MLGTYSYHEIFRKTVVAFGTLFNNIELRRNDEVMKVPLAYGPKAKFLARLDQVPDPTNKRVQITLPRISFEINGITYDSSRKVSPTQKIAIPTSNTKNKNVFMPVPYNLGFELAIISKNQEDGLQILEQILPYFQPHYNLSVKLLPSMNEVKDVPVVLQNIDYEDDYEGDFSTRRAIIYTLQFSVKTYLYGPVTEPKVIKKAIVDYSTSAKVTAPREVRYQVTPTSLQDRDGVVVTTLSSATDADDNLIAVADASGINKFDSIYIDTELFRVSKKSGNNLTVVRAYEGTTAAAHASGANVFLVNDADDALLDSEDDFGFGELTSEFTDIKKRNPVSGADEAI
ncbi:tail assembly protein [Synechococcus phage S-P4]|uniref:Tail assembly protein n=1 Tax=Synechococcus phage S-P4 TaxID=2484640 RepID=A0A3G3M7C6_9CAUD|nr:tail sheath stabilizer [Synechococcus phage S-P4]AYR01838.1 tail assembly protein [Synechococcus phage S-P4]|tara:strand:+ start:939 stop:1967 length:1029 start_codon:yes stop_codon:yes gene_type:complete